jgi:hypothetical protein
LLVRAHSIDNRTEPPLAAEPDPLDEAQGDQRNRPPNANLLIGRDAADKKSRQAGQGERRDQRRFAADTITVMAEDRSADRSCSKADGENRERLQRAG